MQHKYTIQGYTIPQLTEPILRRHCTDWLFYSSESADVVPVSLHINDAVFECRINQGLPATVLVHQHDDRISLSCNCSKNNNSICEYQFYVLVKLLKDEELKIFFDSELRHQRLKKTAADYGMHQETNLDHFFHLNYANGKTITSTKEHSLFAVNPQNLQSINSLLFVNEIPEDLNSWDNEGLIRCIVLKEHKYYKHLVLEMYDAMPTREGKIKSPLTPVLPLTLINGYTDATVIKFLTAVTHFQQNIANKKSQASLNFLKAIVQNPLSYPFYKHQPNISENVVPNALSPVQLNLVIDSPKLIVNARQPFYEITGTIEIEGKVYSLNELSPKLTYFIELDRTLYLVKDLQMLGLIQLFKDKPKLLIHQSQFPQFKAKVLTPLEERMKIDYTFIPPATAVQLQEQAFDNGQERIIYLSDFGQFVMIVPVVRYGEVEIPIRTQKQIHAVDEKGNEFLVKRDSTSEQEFTALLIKQHPYFEEQLGDDLQYFYLHRKRFLDADWFLDAFEEWRNQQITILGFNELSGNQLNAHKVKITIQVLSGIDWFNTKAKVYFGKRRASMKHLHKAIRNKSKFVQLDDGTLGILPEEWIARFTAYFEAGEVVDVETIATPKVNYATVAKLYESDMLSPETKTEIEIYQQRLSDFEGINEVPVPEGLFANLRSYQRQGLNWLNFLDNFNFGGCLADDMGLGKTMQIIAFVLLQRSKVKHNTNLLIVPTSLIFNWQAEVQKFAPSIKILTVYGADRKKDTIDYNQYEIILTTYGTLLSDVNYLKSYYFNYIFLDESQNIKNPESSKYKAVRLLQARNRIAITGTPIENNTFDLFSQLSFACPGLLGSKQYFKDIYSVPIDKFKVSKRAAELQNRVRPFLLRRTKQEVAGELPDKTETVLYCEMQAEQRKIYEAYEKEFREFISATTNEELPKSSMYILKGLTRLRQICNSPALLGEYKLPGEASSKIDMLMEEIEKRSPQHKILVFSQFVGMLELIKRRLLLIGINFAYLTGSTRNREAEVNDFQHKPDTRIFLISLKAGGAGLNLTAADYVYLVDPWWNPAVENQAIDRCYRIGQHKNVVAVRLICPNTIEDKVQKLQDTKKELINTLINNNSTVLKALSKADLLSMLSQTPAPVIQNAAFE